MAETGSSDIIGAFEPADVAAPPLVARCVPLTAALVASVVGIVACPASRPSRTAAASRTPREGRAPVSPVFAAMLVAVALAAATQRVTGVGFALVSAPLLVLGEGSFTGVLLANVLSLATNLVVLAQTWRQVEPRRVALLVVPAVCCVPLGQWAARQLPAPVLMVGIGLVVLAGLAALRVLPRGAALQGVPGAVAAGALSGLMNVTAGVGGPAISLYAAASRWEHARFVGSIQLYFALLNAASVTAKGLPPVTAVQAVLLALALASGLLGGTVLARRVPVPRARQATIALAALGATATVLKGLAML